MKKFFAALVLVSVASPAFAARQLEGVCQLFNYKTGGSTVPMEFNLDPRHRYGLVLSQPFGEFNVKVSMNYAVNPDDLGKYTGDGLDVDIKKGNHSAFAKISGVALNAGETGKVSLTVGDDVLMCEISLK